ncbi:hypothetical protein B0H14DRAFT_2656075 [Mycena olivaceomarginata]|nr:hypothetical protein B0H14DRAFT_2656075 [Mycena olivaceomarginata]
MCVHGIMQTAVMLDIVKELSQNLLKCCIEPVGATSQVKIKPAKGPRLPEKCPGRPPDAEKYTEEIYILCGHTNLETCADVGAHFCGFPQTKTNCWSLMSCWGCGWARQVTQVNEDGWHTAWTVWASRLCGCFEWRGITWSPSGVDGTVRGIPVLGEAVTKTARRLGMAATAAADAAGTAVECQCQQYFTPNGRRATMSAASQGTVQCGDAPQRIEGCPWDSVCAASQLS